MIEYQPDFIGPIWISASEFTFILQYVGEIDPSDMGTDFQLRMLGLKSKYFADQPASDPFVEKFTQYMHRNTPAIEKCFSTYTVRHLIDWDKDILVNLEKFGVTIPDNFFRDAGIRRRLTMP